MITFNYVSRQLIRLFVLIASFSLFTSNLFAFPPFTVQPKISGAFKSESNFFRAETNEREVYASVIEPGVNLGLKTSKSQMLLDYTASVNRYEDQDPIPAGQNSAEQGDYVGHQLIFSATTQPFDRLRLALDEFFLRTDDPASSDRFSNATTRDTYFLNRVTPQVYYEFENKFAAGLKYQNSLTDYKPAGSEDTMENRAIFDLFYNLNRFTAFDLNYQYYQTEYDLNSTDYTSNQVMLILRPGFRVFSFELGAGYHWRNFEGSNLSDLDLGVFRAAILARKDQSGFSITFDHNLNDLGTGDSYFTSDRLSLSADHTLVDKVRLSLGGYYQKSAYETETGPTPAGTNELRQDETYNVTGSVSYIFARWLTFQIQAGVENRDSNLSGFDYDNVFFTFQLISQFDLGKR